MNTSHPRRQAYEYAERIGARLPQRLQQCRGEVGLSRYALALRAGVSRDMVGCIERGECSPGLHVLARLAHGARLSLTEFFKPLEDP